MFNVLPKSRPAKCPAKSPSDILVARFARFPWLSHGVRLSCQLALLALTAGVTFSAGAVPSAAPALAQALPPQATLPNSVANRVIAQAAQQLGALRSQIRILTASPQTWPDGCLGSPAGGCSTAITPGWYVMVSDGLQTVNYRTDSSGQTIRSEDKVLLPRAVAQKLIAQVRRDAKAPVEIVEVKSAAFDGCLGVYRPGQPCSKILLRGWQAVVKSPTQVYVYHLDQTGSRIAQNDTATAGKAMTVSFQRWNEGQVGGGQPPQIAAGVVFESSVTGGLIGSITTITLTEDGKLTRKVFGPPGVQSPPRVLRRLSPQQLAQFKQRLNTARFVNLDGLSYMTTAALADYPTTSYQSQGTLLYFVDSEKRELPRSLQSVYADWQALIRE